MARNIPEERNIVAEAWNKDWWNIISFQKLCVEFLKSEE
jgi:hypothetical protein